MAFKTYNEKAPIMVIDKDNIPDFIWVYPKLPGETLKKIDFRFIKQLTAEIDKTAMRG
jgi:hypothetical protein